MLCDLSPILVNAAYVITEFRQAYGEEIRIVSMNGIAKK